MSIVDEPLQNVLIRPKRSIGGIAVQVIVTENTTDTLIVTKQPVQQGASIGDHSFLEPTVFSHAIYFAAPGLLGNNDSLAATYTKLRDLQASGQPFDIVTPKRIYKSMLMTTLTEMTDKLTENCLAIHASYQQVILVPVSAVVVARIDQKSPAATGGTENAGTKQSALVTGAGGNTFNSLFGGFFK